MSTGPPVSSTTIVCGFACATSLDELILVRRAARGRAIRALALLVVREDDGDVRAAGQSGRRGGVASVGRDDRVARLRSPAVIPCSGETTPAPATNELPPPLAYGSCRRSPPVRR